MFLRCSCAILSSNRCNSVIDLFYLYSLYTDQELVDEYTDLQEQANNDELTPIQQQQLLALGITLGMQMWAANCAGAIPYRSISSRPPGGTKRTNNYSRSKGEGIYVLVEHIGNSKVVVRYVGRGDVPNRIAGHANPKSPKNRYEAIIVANNNLTKEEAHGLEHMLVDFYGGPINAGGQQLVNKDWLLSVRHRNRIEILKVAAPLFTETLGIIRRGIASLRR
jgi:hypothetical protein